MEQLEGGQPITISTVRAYLDKNMCLIKAKDLKKIICILLAMLCLSGCGSADQNVNAAVSLFDYGYSPIVYREQVYFPSEYVVFDSENIAEETIPFGTAELQYDKTDEKKDILLQMDEETNRVYASEAIVTSEEYQKGILEQYEDYVLTEPDSLGKAMDQRYHIDKAVVEQMITEQEISDYRAEELTEADRILVLEAGCVEYGDFLSRYGEKGVLPVGDFYDTEMPVLFVGILLEKDGTWYYGNFDHPLDEDMQNQVFSDMVKHGE